MSYTGKCGSCLNCIDVCCDYCVCASEMAEAMARDEMSTRYGYSPILVIKWAREHLHDMQQDTCERWLA